MVLGTYLVALKACSHSTLGLAGLSRQAIQWVQSWCLHLLRPAPKISVAGWISSQQSVSDSDVAGIRFYEAFIS